MASDGGPPIGLAYYTTVLVHQILEALNGLGVGNCTPKAGVCSRP